MFKLFPRLSTLTLEVVAVINVSTRGVLAVSKVVICEAVAATNVVYLYLEGDSCYRGCLMLEVL